MSKDLGRLVAWAAITASPALPFWSKGKAPPPVIRLRVYNVAHVGSLDLAGAERIAAVTFARAGIATDWKDGAVSGNDQLSMDFSPNTAPYGSCTDTMRGAEIKVQLIRSTPRVTLPGALGFALPCASFGVRVTVFADRCEEVLRRNWTSSPHLLGYVMAHEIGHLLLGSGHAEEGIMRARWTQADWRAIAAGNLAFLPRQADRMRDMLSQPSSGPVRRVYLRRTAALPVRASFAQARSIGFT